MRATDKVSCLSIRSGMEIYYFKYFFFCVWWNSLIFLCLKCFCLYHSWINITSLEFLTAKYSHLFHISIPHIISLDFYTINSPLPTSNFISLMIIILLELSKSEIHIPALRSGRIFYVFTFLLLLLLLFSPTSYLVFQIVLLTLFSLYRTSYYLQPALQTCKLPVLLHMFLPWSSC